MPNGGVESPDAEERQATKGRGLRRWRRIRRERQGAHYVTTVDGGASDSSGRRADEDSVQPHKRRLLLPADAPKAKHEPGPVEVESSIASRFIPHAPAKLDPGLGFLIESTEFAIGADSDHREDTSSRSASGHDNRPRSRVSLHGKHPRAARSRADDRLRVHADAGSTETENSRSRVESDLRSSNAMKTSVTGNGVDKGLSASGGHGDENRPSEEVRSLDEARLARGIAESDDADVDETLDEGSLWNGHNVGLHSGADPYTQSIWLLQKTQEALENEIEKIVAASEVPSDEFDIYDDEWNVEEPIEEISARIKHLESRLEEASALIKEKDSTMLELGALGWMQHGKTAIESTNFLLSQSEVDGLYQEKMQAEIQCIVLTRASQTLATLVDDQIMAQYDAQKSLCEDYRQLGVKLRHAGSRALVLEEKAEKLEMQCKELSTSSQLLQLQSKAGRVSLFCFVQFVLLCVAIGTYLTRLLPSSSDEVVPT